MPRVAPLVFLASTTKDLQPFRDVAQDVLRGRDLLYRGMEYFGSQSQKAHDAILDDLVMSDLFVGLIGFRYGDIDPQEDCSFVESEYRTASKHEIDCLILMMAEGAPVRAGDVERSELKQARLERFRTELKKDRTVVEFVTPEDLKVKLADSVDRWLAMTRAERELRLHEPLNDHEVRYVRNLHSPNLTVVHEAIERLGSTNNRIAFEHLYAAAYRQDLSAEEHKWLLTYLMRMPDEARVREALLSLAEDLPMRLRFVVFAIGHRSLLPGRTIADCEIECLLTHTRHPDAAVRGEVAHALGKVVSKVPRRAADCIEALHRLKGEDNPDVADRATEALKHAPRAQTSRPAS